MSLSAKINGFELNDPNNGITVDGEITGLGMPDIRTSSGVYSGRSGGYVGAQHFGLRNVSVPGQIIGNNPAEYEAVRKALAAAVPLDTILPLEITTVAGNQIVLYCKLVKLDIPFVNNPITTRYNLELVAPDPVIYDNSAGGLNSLAISPVRGGGITWPITWPITWTGSSGPVTAHNAGEVVMSPVVTLTGSMTNPILTNVTTDQFVDLTGLIANNSTVVIDMGAPSVLLDGGTALPYVSTASEWIGLVPGDNLLRLTTSNNADTVTGTVEWRTGYMAA